MDNRLPYYMTYPMPFLYEEDRSMRRDLDYMKSIYPMAAKRLIPYVEEECDRMEYSGSMMYDEYPDQLSLLRKAKEVWEGARAGEDFGEKEPAWEQLQDLIGVLLLQEMMRRRKRNRGRFWGMG